MAGPAARKIYILKIGIIVAMISAYFLVPGVHEFFQTGIAYLRARDFENLRSFILSYGMWAPLTSIALMVMQSVIPLVPGIVITITNAWIFGWEFGAVYSWTGALLGAVIDFSIARWYGRPMVEEFIPPKVVDLVDRFFTRFGVLAVFVSRLTPVIPFKAISYSAGLTAIPLRRYLFATGVGQAPAILLYSFLGHNLTKSIRLTVAFTLILLLLGIAGYYFRDSLERFLPPKK